MKNIDDICKTTGVTVMGEPSYSCVKKDPGIILRFWYDDPVTGKRYNCRLHNHDGWEHLSVSGKNKVPSYEIMCKLKDICFKDEETCVEYHPAKSEYVNNAEYTLHIWKPKGHDIEHPNSILVGLPGNVSGKQVAEAYLATLSKEEQIQLAQKLYGMKINRNMRRK